MPKSCARRLPPEEASSIAPYRRGGTHANRGEHPAAPQRYATTPSSRPHEARSVCTHPFPRSAQLGLHRAAARGEYGGLHRAAAARPGAPRYVAAAGAASQRRRSRVEHGRTHFHTAGSPAACRARDAAGLAVAAAPADHGLRRVFLGETPRPATPDARAETTALAQQGSCGRKRPGSGASSGGASDSAGWRGRRALRCARGGERTAGGCSAFSSGSLGARSGARPSIGACETRERRPGGKRR